MNKSNRIKSNRLQKINNTRTPDTKLLLIVSILVIWGVIMVYSGSVITAVKQNKPAYYFFMMQVVWIIAGSIGGYIAYKINYKILPKIALYGFIATIFLLILVLVINYDLPIKRWIPIGPFTLQPSELMKLVFFVYLSSWLANKKSRISGTVQQKFISHLQTELIPYLVLLATATTLIIVEPDLDTAMIIGLTSFVIYFVAGDDLIHLFTTFILTNVLGVLGIILTQAANYRLNRIVNWIGFWRTGQIQDPFGTGYQLRQILVAVASGGFWGLGFGESRQKFHYLGDTAFTDTIFAIFAEEFGLIGSSVLIFLFIYLIIRGYKIAKGAPDKFSMLLATSITTWIGLQAFLHIASNVALIPINGNTLPFISYGGSSTLINLIAIGLLLNISKYSKNH